MPYKKFLSKLIFLSLLLILNSCSINKDSQSVIRGKHCQEKRLARLYFGSATPDGQVTNQQWQNFLKEQITPLFPAGLTVIEGQGQWLGEDKKIVSETSRMVEIIYDDSPEQNKSISEIVSFYKTRFRQEAVMELYMRTAACL